MNSKFDLLNKNFCAIICNNTNSSFLNFCKNNLKDFKVINIKQKQVLHTMFNNTSIIIISTTLLKKKYVNLLLPNSLYSAEIFGILYDNSLWELDKFISIIQLNNLNLSNIFILNKFFLFEKLLLLRLILLLTKQCVLKK